MKLEPSFCLLSLLYTGKIIFVQFSTGFYFISLLPNSVKSEINFICHPLLSKVLQSM